MLNVLLSFAQFEREITGERILDKIAASKAKGMWMGGMVPMGYELRDRRLAINEAEAETILGIFRLDLELGDVPALLERIKQDSFVTAPRRSGKRHLSGSQHFTRGHVYKLLSNPIYIGRVRHKTVSYLGQHAAIIDMATWTAVQEQLSGNTQGPRKRRRRATEGGHLLHDLLVASDGNRFIPAHANKGSRRYQYYVEEVGPAQTPRRLPAAEIERAVLAALSAYLLNHQQLAGDLEIDASSVKEMLMNATGLAGQLGGHMTPAAQELARQLLLKVAYRDAQLELHIIRDALKTTLGSRDAGAEGRKTNRVPTNDIIVLNVPHTKRRRGPQLKLAVAPNGTSAPDRSLLTAVVRARDWAARITAGASVTLIAEQEQVTDRYVSQLLTLAFLAPSIVESIVSGRHPVDLTADRLIWKTLLPLAWREQVLVIRMTGSRCSDHPRLNRAGCGPAAFRSLGPNNCRCVSALGRN